ncbi:MAG: CapA family protein [Tepidiformaceae bacterium]
MTAWRWAISVVVAAGIAAGLGAAWQAPGGGQIDDDRVPAAAVTPTAHTLRMPAVAKDGPPPPPRTVTLSAVGDISLAREVAERMETGGEGYPFARIVQLLSGDIVFGNLEGAFTVRNEPWPKAYTFRTHPGYAIGLKDAGFDVVSLANNHTVDYGFGGLADTVAALAGVGVGHAGAGADAQAASAPLVLVANGLRVAFLAFVATADEGNGFSIRQWEAGPGTPGVAIGSPQALASAVAAARGVADFVVVAVHAGDEYNQTPNATQRALAEAALAAGADAYIGAHAHVVQPVEWRGRQLIAWGLGNFIFDLDEVDLANIPPPRVSLVLELTFTEGRGVTSWRALPVTNVEQEDRPRPATPEEAAILEELLLP